MCGIGGIVSDLGAKRNSDRAPLPALLVPPAAQGGQIMAARTKLTVQAGECASAACR